jgi:HEAT repeat protein
MSAPVTEDTIKVEIHGRKQAARPERQPFNYRLLAYGGTAVVVAGLFYWYMNREPASTEPPQVRRITQAEKSKDIATIAAGIKDQDTSVAVRAVSALGNVGDASHYQYLQPALRDGREQVREAAMRSYAQVGDRQNVEVVSSALANDASPGVRVAAAGALGAMRTTNEPALQALIKGLYDRDPAVRIASISSIETIFMGIRFNYDFRLSNSDPKNVATIAAIRDAA